MSKNNDSGSTSPVLRLLQISDSHLYREPAVGKLIGMNTEDSLQKVLELVEQREFDESGALFDMVLATGDISQDSSEESYQRFGQYVGEFGKPIYWLPGNHDVLATMQSVAGKERVAPCVIKDSGWSIIMLDSTIPGDVPGRLGKEQLTFLEKALQESQGDHVAISLHHHPVPLGSTWLDGVALLNPDDFFAVIDRFDHIKAVIFGHVHQVYDEPRKGVRYFALPSTCIQFKPKSEDFAVDDAVAPGYRAFKLYSDGSIESQVHRLENFSFKVDKSITGY